MASVCSNRRPFSEHFTCSPSPPPSSLEDHSPHRRPRTSVTSHYRPFSTLYVDSVLEALPPFPKSRPRSIIRPISSSGLHALTNMGFGFKEKPKGKEQGCLRTSSDLHVVKPSSPLRTLSSPAGQLPTRPSTSYGPTHNRAVLHRVKKKRSLSSLFSADGIAVDVTSPLNSSPLASSVTLSASSIEEFEDNLDTASTVKGEASTIKGEEKVLAEDDDYTVKDRFTANNIWLNRCKMKMHSYSDDAPYMQAYDPILLENDYYTDVLIRHLNTNGSPSFHDYNKQPPASVLDLGCGQGHWALQAATMWKDSIITAFDLVDITLASFEVLENVKFVRGNFVKYKLPFADKSFEFVRMANLSLCIPYEKWEPVLSEVHRVLTIGGRLELIDDQIFFPYGPMPTPVNRPSSFTYPKVTSNFDLEEKDEDLLDDGDEGEISADTGSTLISDEDSSSASSCEQQQVSSKLDIATPTPLSSAPSYIPILGSPDKQQTPVASTELISTPVLLEAHASPVMSETATPSSSFPRSSTWEREASASRELERVFEDMLNKKSGIHPRPSEFVPELMKLVFGKDSADKMKSFHIKLAPSTLVNGSESTLVVGGSGSTTEISPEKEDSATPAIPEFNRGIPLGGKKAWLNIDWEKKEKKEKEKKKKEKKEGKKEKKASGKDEEPVPATGVSPVLLPAVSQIPPVHSAKAAGRLGISYSALVAATMEERERKEERERQEEGEWKENDRKDSEHSVERRSREAASLTHPADLQPAPRLSAKAAGRLGISYSVLAAATAASTRHRHSPPVSSIPVQSPGIIIWPSTYIPLSPSELEMHACKHIHVLLGCKPALAEWIETFIDDNGERLLEYGEFCETLWRYECFRRARFNWPSELSDSFVVEDEHSPVETSPITPRSVAFRNSATSNIFRHSGSDSDSSNVIYEQDELTHLRTIRVYHATKTTGSSLTSLLFSHNSPRLFPTTIPTDGCSTGSDRYF